MHRTILNILPVTGLILTSILYVGCGPQNTFVAPPPPEVTVQSPDQRTVTVFQGFPGQLEARESVEIRARVAGYLESIDFQDGQRVAAGDQLFVIEPEPYQAALESSLAKLAEAIAATNIASANFIRREKAWKTKAISESDYLTAEADLQAAVASVMDAQASLRQTRLNLSYTTNTAPISGRISRRLVDAGNLVGGSSETLLTTVTSEDPIYAYFNVSERVLLPYLEDLPKGGRENLRTNITEAFLELADGTRYSEAGKLDYSDPSVDPDTGTLRVRAIFPNPNRALVPGLYGKVLLPDKRDQALLVPDLAIQRDLQGPYVLTVSKDNQVSAVYVTPGPRLEHERIIDAGLEGSEQVIVNGLQRARPGIEVTVVPADPKEEPAGETGNKPTAPEAADTELENPSGTKARTDSKE